jgi:serine phosphatase RsbU (regulator of sigma subunit)
MPAWVTDLAATDYPRAEVAGREDLHSGFAFPVPLAGGVLGVMEFFTSEMRSPDRDVLRDMEPVGSQIGQFIERKRAERALAVHRAILASHVEELERTRAELAFLLDASTALAGSLDYEQGIERLARVAASTVCDVCVVDVVEPDGSLRSAASLAADPDAQALADELRDRYPPSLAGPSPAAQAIRERRPVFSSSPTDATLRAASSCADHHSLLRRLGVVSYLAVPLIARGQAIGAVTLAVTARSARSYGEEDLALAGQLARQAALILDNARLYEKERDLAQTLQRNLLPPELPAVPGLELAGRYVPASGRIGGDFYDVFPAGEGRWFMAIGDVCGKGPEAAALTSMVRHTLRGAAMHAGGSPSDVLALVNRALLGQIPESRFCTVACALVTPVARGAWFVVSSAGHPLPLRRTVDGRVAQVGHPGTLLGVFSDVQVEDDHRLLVPGESMAFFTDGALAEADPAALTAEPRLTSLLRGEQGGATAIASVLSRSALESNRRWSHRDDVTVLVASVAGTTA